MMKSLKLLVIIALVLGSLSGLQARDIRVSPRYGVVVTKVHHPRVIVHKGVNFYYAKGVWYKTSGRRYVVCRAPIGIRVNYIPRGYKIVRIKGKKYYTYNGIWYTKKRGFYTVVRIS